MCGYTCCFLGHREIKETAELKQRLSHIIENLITYKNVDTFLFGSKSRFNSLCYELTTNLKGKYPHIRRVYVRAEFPKINDGYEAYLLEGYEHTYFPEQVAKAGRAVYVERNRIMINKSHYCILYYCEDRQTKDRKSGTKIALEYAIRKKKEIVILP